MNILFLADNFPPEKNAQASRVYERACYWQSWRHNVSVITCFPNFPEGKLYPGFENKLKEVSIVNGIRVVRVKTFIAPNSRRVLRILDFLSYMLSAIFAAALEKRPNLVVATSPQFFAAVAGWVLSIIHRVPFVLEISDLWPDSIVAVGAMGRNLALRFLERVELFLYARARRIIVLTNSFKQNLTSRDVPEQKIDVVLNGADLSRYAPRERDHAMAGALGISSGHFVLGYIGTLGMAHGLRNVLRAAALITDPRIRFLLMGPGAEREELIAEQQRLGLSNVLIAPARPKEQMPAVWSVCNVALVHLRNTPLFQTVIPSKIFEAMAMGLPVLLVSPQGEASEIVAREGCGIALAPDNPEELARVASELAQNPAAVQQFASRSLAAAPKYSRERQAREMIAALEKTLIGRKRPARRTLQFAIRTSDKDT